MRIKAKTDKYVPAPAELNAVRIHTLGPTEGGKYFLCATGQTIEVPRELYMKAGEHYGDCWLCNVPHDPEDWYIAAADKFRWVKETV